MKPLNIAIAALALTATVMAETEETLPPEDAGKDLRNLILSMPAEKFSAKADRDFPRIYAVVIDWSIGEHIATIGCARDGWASLYTTSKFGVIGGEGHKQVRDAAIRCVKLADRYYDLSEPSVGFPYPTDGMIYFYLKTYDGLRVIKAPQEAVYEQHHRVTPLFAAAQDVLTELRQIVESKTPNPVRGTPLDVPDRQR